MNTSTQWACYWRTAEVWIYTVYPVNDVIPIHYQPLVTKEHAIDQNDDQVAFLADHAMQRFAIVIMCRLSVLALSSSV